MRWDLVIVMIGFKDSLSGFYPDFGSFLSGLVQDVGVFT